MIDIFVSAPADVQKEHSIAEQLIRSTAAEFNLPINVWYSNPLRHSSAENGDVENKEVSDQSIPVLCPFFWEYPDREESEFFEIPNTGLYDLVICILGSRLGTRLAPQCVMPDGSRPKSATDYEVAWALYQSKQTPGCPGLHVYRSRAIPAAPLEPREQRENLFREWDAVQEFSAAWEMDAGTGFRDCCHDFQNLEEFEDLFRKHFREFLARRLNAAIASSKKSRKVPYSGSNPFRGLDFFDFEHAAVYHGRTKAIGEVFDVLKTQAAAKKPFLLVLGPSGSGKTSFVRAGILPLLTRGATPAGPGPWRRALTRPGATGDPFDAIAGALLAKSALPELQSATSPEQSRELASRLRKDPDGVVARIKEVMDQLSGQELDHLLANRNEEELPARENENARLAKPTSLVQVKPMTQLVLVVDQLEELFTSFSPVIQQKYVAALSALANCQYVFVIATLHSDFCPHYRRFPGLTALGGRYELQPPTSHGIGNILRFRTEAAGLRFEQDPATSRRLDETIVQAALGTPDALPLLEHLLSRLYERQLARKDGSLLWADYQALGGFHNALVQHAEFLFLNLKRDEQEALKFVIRDLLIPSRGEEAFLSRRSVPYRDLVLHPPLDQQQRAGAKGLVDRLIKEGLLSAKPDAQGELLISIPQEALLRRWPRLWELLSKDRRLIRMRERLDASMKPWIIHGRQREDLLHGGIDLAEAQTLLTDFRPHLNETQIDYIKRSLAKHKPGHKVPQKIGAAAIAGLAVFGAFVGGERFNEASRRTDKKQDSQLEQPNTHLDTPQPSKLEAERGSLELQLKETKQKLQIAEQKADLASALETQLKKAEEKLQTAQQNADLAKNGRSALEAELKKAQEETAQLAQQSSNLADNQQSEQETQRSRETQLKDTQDELQVAQKNADLANTQRAALEADLKKAQEEKAQLAQQNSNLANAQSSEHKDRLSLETQLKDSQDKLRTAQKSADLANTQRAALEADSKKTQEEKAQLTQQNSNLANAQSSEHKDRLSLETQLKDTQDKLQLAQESADLADTQHSALDNQLKDERVKLEQAQAEANDAKSQLRTIQAQLKQESEKEQNKQADTNSSTREIRAVSPNALTGSKTEVAFEEKQDNLPREKDAPLTPPQDAAPLPSPAKESEPLNSAKPQSVLSPFADDKASVKQFVLGYIKSVASDETSLQRPYFGDRVNYYGEGVIGSPHIEASLERYRTQWPVRNWEPRGEAKVARLKDPNVFSVLQPFNWAVSDGSNQSHGNATLYARVRKTSEGKFQIEYLRQLTADHSVRRHRKRK